jgi:hypothetical protein
MEGMMANRFREGLYKAEFNTLKMEGIGLVVLFHGRIYGGDTMTYYVGTYTVEGDVVSAEVKAATYKGMPIAGIESVFGRDKNTIHLEGQIHGSQIELEARSKQASGIPITIKLQWLSE